MVETLFADIRYALRWLRHSPMFALVAVASLAIGIGFNSALFTLVDAALFRPLPVERPDRLVDVFTMGGDGDMYATSSYPDAVSAGCSSRAVSRTVRQSRKRAPFSIS